MRPLRPIKQSFSIKYEYRLHFTADVFNVENEIFKNSIAEYGQKGRTKILFVIDDKVASNHPKLINHIDSYCHNYRDELQFTEALIVPGGEEAKSTDDSVKKVLKAINTNHICRHSFVVAIGGGAVIDMVGYAAATAHRGVQLIRIPTTVLAQNDAAVGVKNGINAFGKKNFLGTFATPFSIINDSQFLKTLEDRDWIAGIAEGIKVALIKDAAFFDKIEAEATKLFERDPMAMQDLIYRCAQLHMEHIATGGDPFESGSSRPLDFGHWAAHKLEQMTHYEVRHGEAVAKGMALDLIYAKRIGLISEKTLIRILKVLCEVGFSLHLPLENEDIDVLLEGIEEFREHLGGELTITLIDGIGSKYDVHIIDLELMKASIHELNERCAQQNMH